MLQEFIWQGGIDLKQLKDYSLINFELQNLFRARLNQDQIHYISKIIKILAKHMVLNRTMIEFYANEKIGLSYLVNAVNFGLITELKYKDDKEEKNIFHFHLLTAGISFAETEGFLLNKLPLSADNHVKNRIVTFNQWAMEKSFDLSDDYGAVGYNYSYFISKSQDCEKQIVCFYKNLINEKDVAMSLLRQLTETKKEKEEKLSLEDIYNTYLFKQIDCEFISIGNKSSASDSSLVGE